MKKPAKRRVCRFRRNQETLFFPSLFQRWFYGNAEFLDIDRTHLIADPDRAQVDIRRYLDRNRMLRTLQRHPAGFLVDRDDIRHDFRLVALGRRRPLTERGAAAAEGVSALGDTATGWLPN